MTILREADNKQLAKNEGSLDLVEMLVVVDSCNSGCWDCDGCTGSVTH